MWQTKIVTDVTKEWLTSVDVKEALRISFDDDNQYIKELINGARKAIEKHCGISIGTQSLQSILDCFGYEEIEIPFGPVQTLSTVKYKTSYGEYTTNTDDYDVDGLEFKTFTPFITGRWELTYTAGYSTIPYDLKNAWIRLVGYYYENRGDMDSIPANIKKDLINYKRLGHL
jgi:uncharacterized phiE125 gp8 family phage protein